MKFFVEIKRKVGDCRLGLKVDLGRLVSWVWKASIVLWLILPDQTVDFVIEAPNTILV